MTWHCPFRDCSVRDRGDDDLYDHLVRVHDELSEYDVRRYEYAEYRRQALIKLQEQIGGKARDWTLETFPASDVAGRRALNSMRRWIEEDDDYTATMYIDGQPGTGKTGLAISATKRIIDWCHKTYEENPDGAWSSTDDIEFVNVRAFLEEQRERFSLGEPKDVRRLLKADLLTLDDLGAETPTAFAVETISLVVEHRHARNKTTIVTTNYKPSELAERLGRDDPVAGQRIVSRLLEDATRIELNRADLRVRKAA